MATRMQQRRGTTAQWTSINPVLGDGEIGYDKDTRIIKVGDGITPWLGLTVPDIDGYVSELGGSTIALTPGAPGLILEAGAGYDDDILQFKDAEVIGNITGRITASGEFITNQIVSVGTDNPARDSTMEISNANRGNTLALIMKVHNFQTEDIVRIQNHLGDVISRIDFEGRYIGPGPLGCIGYAQATSNQAGITAEVDLTGLSIVVNVQANRRLKITQLTYPSSTGNNEQVTVYIKEVVSGIPSLLASRSILLPVANLGVSFAYSYIITNPIPGDHTYKVAMVRTTAMGSVTNNAAATFPSYIVVEDIGAV